MTSYIIRRILYMLPTLLIISIVSFIVIQLAPGDFLTRYEFNERIDRETFAKIRENLGLDKPGYVRYWRWLKNIILHGDFGYSFELNRPVTELFLERLPITLLVTIPVFLFVWLISLPLGIYSATHQYSIGDHTFTFLGFLGLSIPNFFFALAIMYFLAVTLNVGSQCWNWPEVGRYCLGVGGLFHQGFQNLAWSWHKFLDYLWHLWPAVIVIGSSGTAGLLRIMRGTLLDILGAQYVKTARAKGLKEQIVIYKHAVRNAINPMISIFGQSLPGLISGALITAIVLNIPNVERLYFEALLIHDEYVIMTILTFFAFALLLGNLLADIMLAWVDPRIRYD